MLKLVRTFNINRLGSTCSLSTAAPVEKEASAVQESSKTAKQHKKVKLVEYLKNIDAEHQEKILANMRFDRVTNTELKFYDPPYLERPAPFPNYTLLNINLKGYDYTSLNMNYKTVESICRRLGVKVVEAYPMPARSINIKTYQPFSTNIDKNYELNMYHRVVRVQNLKSTLAPILFEAVQLNLPEGVHMNVSIPDREEDDFRYVPDIELQEMRAHLSNMTSKNKLEKEIALQEATAAKAAAKAATVAKQAAAQAALKQAKK